MAGERRALRLHVVQAAYGDCLLVEVRSGRTRHHLLVDGGPATTYEAHLRSLLVAIARPGAARPGAAIDLAVLSHVDNDHVRGLLALFEDLRSGRAVEAPLPPVLGLWHNSVEQALGSAELAPLVKRVVDVAGVAGDESPSLSRVRRAFEEGDALRVAARRLRIPINAGFPRGDVTVGAAPETRLGQAAVHVVGPSADILERLQAEWRSWLQRHRRGLIAGAREVAVAADRSVPNLSSICLLVELGRRSILLTGDARGDQVLDGLAAAGALDGQGRRHVSILKLPHHGSARNVDRAFLQAISADVYVVSADGRYGNPDYDALVMVLESARERGGRISLVATNPTEPLNRLLETHPPESHGYEVRVLAAGRSAITVEARARRRSDR